MKCFACGKTVIVKGAKSAHMAITSDGQTVVVGPECFRRITKAGYQPPGIGPKLYPYPKMLTEFGEV